MPHINHFRPKKRKSTFIINITKSDTPENTPVGKGYIKSSGRIADWAYYGDCSPMIIAGEANQRLGVVFQNSSRDVVDALDIRDDVDLSWLAQDMLVLND
ncbi:MAG: TOBE domain-containing protein [Hyphomicrobiales bacterium]|nr:TOBE domain-containing protein [Hyphomicrobiales bacterium]